MMVVVEVEPIKEAEELCDKIQEYAITRYFINEFTCTIHPNIDKDLKIFINSFLIYDIRYIDWLDYRYNFG